MIIERLGKRNVLFKYKTPEWDLYLHLIIGEKYNYIIDTGLGSKSVTPVKDYLGSNQNPIVVINTHYHWDHIWGNNYFCNSTIISHSTCRELIITNWDETAEKFKHFISGDVKICLPNLVFEDSIYFPDDKIKVFYTPGHTIDSISVFDEQDNVLNVGDNIGDTMDEIVPVLETDKEVFLHSILKYKALEIDACISGHNAILGKDVFEKIEKIITS